MGVLRAKVNGAWVDIGNGSGDAVWVGPDPPVPGDTELWYDTDAIGTGLGNPSWNTPWGHVGRASAVADQAGFGTASMVDINGMAIVFTAIAGRLYKVTAQLMAAGAVVLSLTDQTNAQMNQANAPAAASGGAAVVTMLHIVSLSAGTYTFKLRAQAQSGTVTILGHTAYPRWLLIEDIGPVVRV